MKRIVGIVVPLQKLDKEEGFGELIHGALRAVQIYATSATCHDVSASFADQAINGFPAALVVGDVPAGTEILHAGVNLLSQGKRSQPCSALNRTFLFRIEDA